MDVRKLLIFHGLSEEELEKSLHCTQSVILEFQKNAYIFHQEDTPKRLYFVLEGEVEVGSVNPFGKLARIELLKEGDGFGEIEMFLHHLEYNCYAKAGKRAKVLAVAQDFFCGRCERNCVHHGKVVFNMLEVFAKKADKNNRQIELLTIGNLRQRVAAYLLEASRGGTGIKLDMNREELAAYLNTTRPSLSRMLLQMQDEGILELPSRNRIRILDAERLQEIL